MNKSQLINAVSDDVALSKSTVKKVVDSLLKITESTLSENDKLVISGFGVFSVSQIPERTGRNPRTGERVKIAPRRNIKFRSNMDIE